jgi:hypothetical protein
MTREQFIVRFGYEPIDDDLERVECARAGQFGHRQCGMCERHECPRFQCGCLAQVIEEAHDR